MFVAKMQRRLLSAEIGYFKWHCCMINNRVWFDSLFKERNKFGEYNHALRALRRRPAKYVYYLRMSVDTFDYILSNVCDSPENQTV